MSHSEPDPLSYLTEPIDGITEFFDEIIAANKRREEAIRAIVDMGSEFLSALPGGDWIKSQVRLALNPVELAPSTASAAKQYEHYQLMLEARGFTVDPDTPTVVALRGLSHAGEAHDTTSAQSYDDTIVVLNRDAKGNPVVTTLAGSTHPGQTEAPVGGKTGVPDVNKDGKADVGMIHPGEYRLVPHGGGHVGAAAWDVRTVDGSGQLPGVRDTNQDGNFSKAERDDSTSRSDALTGVMIHQGGATQPWSAGCINMSQNPQVYGEFIKAAGGSSQSMKLVILDKNAN